MNKPARKRFIARAVSSEGRLIPGFRTYRFQAESLEVAAQYVLRRVRPPPGFHNFRMRVEEVIPRRWREYLMFWRWTPAPSRFVILQSRPPGALPSRLI